MVDFAHGRQSPTSSNLIRNGFHHFLFYKMGNGVGGGLTAMSKINHSIMTLTVLLVMMLKVNS